MQLGKILAAGTMGLLMAGSTLAFAATLADYPQPFIASDGAADFLVVVGATAMPEDVVGAIDVATRLGSESFTSYSCPGSSGATTVTGEGAAVGTPNTKILFGENLKKSGARYTFTSTDLPTVLKGGSVTDSTLSTTYAYNQYIELSDDYKVQFAKYLSPPVGVQQDPQIVLRGNSGSNLAVTTSNYLYKAKAVFEKEVNGTTTIGEKINLFGKSYTIASGTTFPLAGTQKLVLYGSAETQVLTEGVATKVTISGVEYDVKLMGVPGTTTIVLQVGTDQKSVTKQATATVGGLQIYVDDVFQYSSTRSDNQAKVSFGAQTITFQDGKAAYTTVGGTDVDVKGTYVDLSASDGKLTMIEIYVAGSSSSIDVLKAGQAFKDPIFGTFSVDFASVTPDIMSSDKSTLDIKSSGDNDLTATFMDYRGKTATVTWAHDADSIDLEDSAGYKYVVVEGAAVKQSEYVVLDSGGYSHLMQLSTLSNDGTTSGYVELTDIFSGTTYNVLMGTDNQSTKVIDGQTYYINGNTTEIRVTWGDASATYDNVGAAKTVWPIIPGTKGEVYAFAANPSTITVANTTMLVLPTGTVLETVSAPSTGTVYLTLTGYTAGGYTASGCTNLNLSNSAATCDLLLGKTATGASYYKIGATSANNTVTVKPAGSTTTAYTEEAIVLVEEQDSLGNVYSVWVPAANETNNIVQIMSGAPDFTYNTVDSTTNTGVALVSNSYKVQMVDLYGAFAEKSTYGQDTVKLWYPDTQATMDFFVLGPDGAVSTQAAATGGTVNKQTSVKTAVAKLDKDVSEADKNNDNIILVGGPAVNTLVAELAAGSTPLTKDRDWYVTEGKGTAIIDLVADAWGTGKAALVVAGHSWDDTKAVTDILLNYDAHASDLTGTRAIFKNGILSTEAA
ncbi:MAG: S-layer protein [Candidatus Aenigmarchaeota archaeon]|nr:S-layer protein [Candidatus Aenigmarchaeota archaeon]